MSTGSGTKGEEIFEWQYVEVNCNVKEHKKYLIFRRDISEKPEISATGQLEDGGQQSIECLVAGSNKCLIVMICC